jgi:hypothetical protein
MKNLVLRVCIIVFLTFNLSFALCEAQIFGTGSSKNFERRLFGKSTVKKETKKVKEPRKVSLAKRKQSKNDAKLKKDYAKFIKESQKRSIEIQTPEVQERMKQNRKQTVMNNKERQKAVKVATKKAGKKYN